ncbi:hypothetical protein [Altericroceibacterium xinjiangense]|uniref:hypothetical protein n=1 Tax=Altericroceibacterium xinjiangense TaxID=762261 RepID=UPI000F7E6534|nr:hypothetical protein [Altericroceibacterium xinjiangense]
MAALPPFEKDIAAAHSHLLARSLPVILSGHTPGLACLAGNGPHIHHFALSCWVGINDFGEVNYHLCSDHGPAEDWQAHLSGEREA